MQSIRIIIFAILVCDVIRGNNVTIQNKNNTEHDYEKTETSNNTRKIFKKDGSETVYSLVIVLVVLIIAPFLSYFWYNWFLHRPIVTRIRATFRIFWQRYVYRLFYLCRRSESQQISNELNVSYNSRAGVALNI